MFAGAGERAPIVSDVSQSRESSTDSLQNSVNEGETLTLQIELLDSAAPAS